jgi:hypothetical protein
MIPHTNLQGNGRLNAHPNLRTTTTSLDGLSLQKLASRPTEASTAVKPELWDRLV